MTRRMRNIVLLAGGVGGARMAEGFARMAEPGRLSVVVNVGDDETFYGLHVSPDIDTVLYTLSDRIDRKMGWGVADDATRALGVLADLGAPTWMKLGDADLGLHIWRSWRLAEGERLTEVTRQAARSFGIAADILPATDAPVRTRLLTDGGWQDFQSWFVGARCEPRVHALDYRGAASAAPGAEVTAAIGDADLIVLAPSNPLLSIEPMLAIPGLRAALSAAGAPRIAVSPLIGGEAVKGPLVRLLADLGQPGGAYGVARRYDGLIDGFVADSRDAAEIAGLHGSGIATLTTDILMPGPEAAERLARTIVDWCAAQSWRARAEAS